MLNTMEYLSELKKFKAANLEDVDVYSRDGKEFKGSNNIADFIGTVIRGFNENNELVEIPFVDVQLAVALLINEGKDAVRYTEASMITFEEGGYYLTTVKGQFTGINYKLDLNLESEFNYWNPIVKEEITGIGHIITYYDGKSFLIKK